MWLPGKFLECVRRGSVQGAVNASNEGVDAPSTASTEQRPDSDALTPTEEESLRLLLDAREAAVFKSVDNFRFMLSQLTEITEITGEGHATRVGQSTHSTSTPTNGGERGIHTNALTPGATESTGGSTVTNAVETDFCLGYWLLVDADVKRPSEQTLFLRQHSFDVLLILTSQFCYIFRDTESHPPNTKSQFVPAIERIPLQAIEKLEICMHSAHLNLHSFTIKFS